MPQVAFAASLGPSSPLDPARREGTRFRRCQAGDLGGSPRPQGGYRACLAPHCNARVHWMRNALAPVSHGQHIVLAGPIRQAFDQPGPQPPGETWRRGAGQIRSRWPMLAEWVDMREHDVVGLHCAPPVHASIRPRDVPSLRRPALAPAPAPHQTELTQSDRKAEQGSEAASVSWASSPTRPPSPA